MSTTRLLPLLAIACASGICSAQASDRPNIIYIMSDDMGYSDIGCYGSEIATPNLDRLAENGLRFTQFYNTARCCPTRACLLSGLYPHQAGIGHMMSDSGYDGYRGELNRHCVTLAEVLGSAGYRTYMSGKWHVTQKISPQGETDKQNWPLQRGFDRFYGTIHGAGSFYDPNSLTRDNELISPYADPEYQPQDGFYYTDAIADQAVRFVTEHRQQHTEQPFFLYVSFTAAHWPMHARERDIDKYRGRYDAGYQAIRDARYAKMLDLGVIDAQATTNWPIPEQWKESENLEWDVRNMEVYAAMIDSMDQGIGRLVSALQETQQFDNTLLLFFQDNGGCAENYGRGGAFTPRADEPSLPPLADDYLQPDMQPKQTRDGYPVRTGKGTMAGPADTYIGYGRGWATVSNTPFREYKHWVHEGGISTPLIAHWPRRIDRHGQLEATPSHLIDLMATAVDAGQANYPTRFHEGQEIYPMEGSSLLPVFAGKGLEREAIYWEHEGNRAVRVGDWKLVAKSAEGDWELYNIAQDRSEQQDLAASEPDRVAEMGVLWKAWAERAHVLPLTPYYSKKDASFRKNKLKFTLKADANLDRTKAPYVPERGIDFSASISQLTDGVLVAQGGVTHGWAVYVQGECLCFALTRHGQRMVIRSSTLRLDPQQALQVHVKLDKQGQVSLAVNGQSVGQGEVGLVSEQPADGLQIGQDLQGNVGKYTVPFAYSGTISDVQIKLTK